MEPSYVKTIQYPLSCFANISTINNINHLYNTYGEIDENDLDNNDIKKKSYYPDHTLATLTKKLGAGRYL